MIDYAEQNIVKQADGNVRQNRLSGLENLPQPVPPGIDYYALRAQDYAARHPAESPPDYYLHYGDKYCRRFCLSLRRRLSPAGRLWIDNTCNLLQQMIEARRAENPAAFARLEEDGDAFRRYAYSTHAAAYIQGGIAALGLLDLLLILAIIDLKDLFGIEALSQMLSVLIHLAGVHTGRMVALARRPMQLLSDQPAYAGR